MWFIFYFIIGVFFYFSGIYFLSMDYLLFVDWEIINLNSCSVVMTLLFDWISLLFIGRVILISGIVILYRYSYISGDLNNIRFLFLVLLFVLSMCFMIIRPNLIRILLGWDGLGLVSYCLVIYFCTFKSYGAGIITVLTNRIGDVAILLGIGLLFNCGRWYFLYYSFYNYTWSYLFLLFVVLASFTRRAQIPFSSWLPAAMAAPTPVSALVHSSTLVTAGVYILIRFRFLLYQYNLYIFLFISVFTIFISGLGANFEYDMKKIIALSTLSQLGLIMRVLFMGFPVVSFFHLLTHAFFKALLFLCSGLFIHCMNDTQDVRYMGCMVNNLPYVSICFGVSNLSLCGLPYLSGFYRRDLVLELLRMTGFNLFIYFLFYLSVGLTVSYSVRLVYFSIVNNVGLLSFNNYSEDFYMIFSIIFLVIIGVLRGCILSWLIFPFPSSVILSLDLRFMPLLIILSGSLLGYFFSLLLDRRPFGLNNNFVIEFLGGIWFIPIFIILFCSGGLYLSNSFLVSLESGWGEFLVSRFMGYLIIAFGKFNFAVQLNYVKVYFFLFFLITVLVILI